jgi:hypothetical protein
MDFPRITFPQITMNGAKYQMSRIVMEEDGEDLPVIEIDRRSDDGVILTYYMHPTSPRNNFMTSFRNGDYTRTEITSRSSFANRRKEMNRVDAQALDVAIRYFEAIENNNVIPPKEKNGLGYAMFDVVRSVERQSLF